MDERDDEKVLRRRINQLKLNEASEELKEAELALDTIIKKLTLEPRETALSLAAKSVLLLMVIVVVAVCITSLVTGHYPF